MALNGCLATQLSRFTLWHNRRWASQLAGKFTLWHNGHRAKQPSLTHATGVACIFQRKIWRLNPKYNFTQGVNFQHTLVQKYRLKTSGNAISETLNCKMSLDALTVKNLCLWYEFQSCLPFIISLLLKNFLTAPYKLIIYNLLIFFDNLVQSKQSPHPSCLTVLSQVSIHLVDNSRPFIRKVMAKNLAHAYSKL